MESKWISKKGILQIPHHNGMNFKIKKKKQKEPILHQLCARTALV